jgi:hypothetical protein
MPNEAVMKPAVRRCPGGPPLQVHLVLVDGGGSLCAGSYCWQYGPAGSPELHDYASALSTA